MAADALRLEEARGWKGEEHYCQVLDDALAIMGRYGKQDMIALSRDISVKQLFQWVRAIDRMIERENEHNRRPR